MSRCRRHETRLRMLLPETVALAPPHPLRRHPTWISFQPAGCLPRAIEAQSCEHIDTSIC
eukprot:757180-Hanusia_phi.AAC.2